MQSSRIGDVFVGTCFCHPVPIGVSGVIIQGSDVAYDDDISSARLTDIGVGSCGHLTTIITGSTVHYDDDLASARVSDTVSGCIVGTIITGSPVVDHE